MKSATLNESVVERSTIVFVFKYLPLAASFIAFQDYNDDENQIKENEWKIHEFKDWLVIEPGEDHHLISSVEDPIVVVWCHAGATRNKNQL
ncbi:hypothetical protein QFZ77_006491 [Paenibacillus sp. V4I3]|uniref:hypothetical protein n=1 Tax=Paenibacillus sp. V4I3 TaxID=3042305 RepID=UPI0027844C26|nr:hypothetical protein [Paenibacillus sp. V4I3]MDQ0877832.1 hypothetical protein [Paenibacillus sp. V4I3]